MHSSTIRLFAACLFCATTAFAQNQANWPQWRGPRDNGSTEAGTYPVKWDATTNLLWKASLPGKGCSTPVVWEKRIFVTAPVGGQNAALAFDWSGKPLWQVAFTAERAGKHRNGSGSNPSPVTDGQGVFVYFKSGDFAALELDGRVRWKTNLVEAFGGDTLYWDYGTSPVLTESDVLMAKMHQGESWLAAFDKRTGALRWKAARNYPTPAENDHGYTSPLVIRQQGKEVVLLWGAEHLTAHAAADGKLLWSCGGFNPDGDKNWPAVAMPVVVDDMALISFGRSDRGKPRLHGIKLGGTGDVTSSNRMWMRQDTGSFVPSPVEYQGRVYFVRDRGEVECLEPLTGRTVWKGDLPRSSANFYSSPVVAGGKLYAAREDGVMFVTSMGEKFEVLAENTLGERTIASPVPVANRLLIRGEQHLFCVGVE